MPLLRIGLTGGMGAGKSTVASEFAALGAEVISGDDLGRCVLEESPALLEQIRARFGPDAFDETGALNRRALGRKAFADPAASGWLTELTFPGIHALWLDAVARCASEVIVFDAALIFEWGIEREFDQLIVVVAERESVLRRLVSSGRWSEPELDARLRSQLPPETKAARADVVLRNDQSLPQFRDDIRKYWASRVEPELQQRRKSANVRSV